MGAMICSTVQEMNIYILILLTHEMILVQSIHIDQTVKKRHSILCNIKKSRYI
jgi:hypothetical protein